MRCEGIYVCDAIILEIIWSVFIIDAVMVYGTWSKIDESGPLTQFECGQLFVGAIGGKTMTPKMTV